MEPVNTPYHAPNANPSIERWGRSLREECLNHLIVFGIKSLRRVVALYRRHFNEKRPHQGIGNRVPCRVRTGHTEPTGGLGAVGKVECEEFLGGLLKSYRRAAWRSLPSHPRHKRQIPEHRATVRLTPHGQPCCFTRLP